MVKDFKPSVSVEEMAAYLDGNLIAEEISRLDAIIASDSDMQSVLLNSENIVYCATDNQHDTFTTTSNIFQSEAINLEDIEMPQIPISEFDSSIEVANVLLGDMLDMQLQDNPNINDFQQDTLLGDMGNSQDNGF